MKNKIIAVVAIAFSSCSYSLRKGWVKTDFLDGKIPRVAVCTFQITLDGDIEAICRNPESTKKLLEEHPEEMENWL